MIENYDKLISDKELKQLLLGVMDCIDKFCRKNKITYYMLGGTMLGAIRHKGFIPWDDDIDIGLTRKEYTKFCKTFNEYSDRYKIICVENDENYYLPFAKVIDNHTTLQEDVKNAPSIGVYIDVFPLDYVSVNNPEDCAFFRNKFIMGIQSLKYMNIKKERAFWKNLLIYMSRIIYPFSLHEIAKKRESLALSIGAKEEKEWIANLHGAWGVKEVVKSSYFKESKDYIFEGRYFMGPIDADGYLHSLYGDYMTPPPPEKRVSHHGFIAKWK